MNVNGVSPSGAAYPVRSVIDHTTGFADSLEAMLRAPAPAATPGPATTAPAGTIQFSRHAAARMASRGISLNAEDLADLSDAVDTLAKRGARESLVLMDDNAFIVGVPDRKVVTALTRREAVGTVFTQIDSTVVVR